MEGSSVHLYTARPNPQTCASMQTRRGALVAVEFPVWAQGCVFTVYEEHAFMIDERPESDSPLNITLPLKCGKPSAGSCGASDVRFLRSCLRVGAAFLVVSSRGHMWEDDSTAWFLLNRSLSKNGLISSEVICFSLEKCFFFFVFLNMHLLKNGLF